MYIFMALSRRIARPLLASAFVVEGFDAVRSPAEKVTEAQAVTEPLSEYAGIAGLDAEVVVRVNGCVQIVAGMLLATGKLRRLASVVLMGTLIPATYAGNRFWLETDEAVRSQQRMRFVKNVGLLGGLILAAVDTEGAPSLGWRARRRVRQMEDRMHHGRQEAMTPVLGPKSKAVAVSVSKTGRRAIGEARDVGGRALRRLDEAELDPAEILAAGRKGLHTVQSTVSDRIGGENGSAAHALQQATSVIANAARQLEPLAESKMQAAVKVASDGLSKLEERLPDS
jgi:putative oxidoreductase